MADEEFSKDTRPLDPAQLSDDEIIAIHDIEELLRQATTTKPDEKPHPFLATAEHRHPRVLLLDGGRGTGKTSLMLTMVERWRRDKEDHAKQAYASRIEKLCASLQQKNKLREPNETKDNLLNRMPENLIVLRILDFDRLPPEVPLVAAIIQAWRPLVDELGLDNEEDGQLIDSWEGLFRFAATGWSATTSPNTVSQDRSLIDQVLDREEQVKDWHDLGLKWREFVDTVIARGRKLNANPPVTSQSVFVIMIDDCDLQVQRVRELLPALRLLYHVKVFFLIAADRPHVIDMLKLDFLGQQNRLALRALHQDAHEAAGRDKWAATLANASFEKVFPIRNRWQLRKLSLPDLLDFASNGQTFRSILNGMDQDLTRSRMKFGKLGDYFAAVSSRIDTADLPRMWTYRTAHQIGEQVLGGRRQDQNTEPLIAREAIGRLLAGHEYDQSLEKGETIEYRGLGELDAFFPAEMIIDITTDGSVELSSQVEFRYGPASDWRAGSEHEDKKTAAVIAATLAEDGYALEGRRLQWEMKLALVWTRMRLAEHEIALLWPLYRHPSPLRLLSWANTWRKIIARMKTKMQAQRGAGSAERTAYAWIYYQLQWMSAYVKDGDPFADRIELDGVRDPLDAEIAQPEGWTPLLSCPPLGEDDSIVENQWRLFTLPLLARPEVGLSPMVQHLLLRDFASDAGQNLAQHRRDLRDERRRTITDAIITAAEEESRREADYRDANNSLTVESIIKAAEERHRSIHKGEPSEWSQVIEVQE